MSMLPIIASTIFLVGYAIIALESKLHINKSGVALFMGALLWILLAAFGQYNFDHELAEAIVEIFNITLFLMCAMALVEIIAHYRVFDVIQAKIFAHRPSDKMQFISITALTFIFSALLDNLTTTIVMIQIATKFFKGKNLLIAAVCIVITANAGGAFSPIGDVTTIMIWLAGKFEAWEVIVGGILPSVALYLTMLGLMLPTIKESGFDIVPEQVEPLSKSETLVVATAGLSFTLPIIVKFFHLPPLFGLLLGLGAAWILMDFFRHRKNTVRTHLTATTEHLLSKIDMSSIKFFIGILFAVSALSLTGVLEKVSTFIYGSGESTTQIIMGNALLGGISSILDNIPLTAIALDILPVTDPEIWVQLALMVGTGGSLLVLGSAAGVVAMGMVKELTFEEYFKIGFKPAAISYVVCLGVWWLQYSLF